MDVPTPLPIGSPGREKEAKLCNHSPRSQTLGLCHPYLLLSVLTAAGRCVGSLSADEAQRGQGTGEGPHSRQIENQECSRPRQFLASPG